MGHVVKPFNFLGSMHYCSHGRVTALSTKAEFLNCFFFPYSLHLTSVRYFMYHGHLHPNQILVTSGYLDTVVRAFHSVDLPMLTNRECDKDVSAILQQKRSIREIPNPLALPRKFFAEAGTRFLRRLFSKL